MNFKLLRFIILLSLFNLLSVQAIFAFDDPFLNSPYLEGTEYELDPVEYADLKSYAKNVPEMLKRILENGQALQGSELREHLVTGIREILRESGASQNLMLFRYNLNRALVVDEIFKNNSTDYKDFYDVPSNRHPCQLVSGLKSGNFWIEEKNNSSYAVRGYYYDATYPHVPERNCTSFVTGGSLHIEYLLTLLDVVFSNGDRETYLILFKLEKNEIIVDAAIYY